MRTNQWFEKGRHTQDPIKALKWYRMAAKTDPNMSPAFHNCGLMLFYQGKYKEAIPQFEKAAELAIPLGDHRSRSSQMMLVSSWTMLGDFDRAEKHAQLAKQLPGPDAELRYAVLQLRVAQGRAAEAIDELKHWHMLDPSNLELKYALATAYAGIGQQDLAIITLTQVLQVAQQANPPQLYFFVNQWQKKLQTWQQKIK